MGLRRPETLTAAVAAHVRNAIIRGEFQPGARLRELALSDELETSRGTVREALRMLAESGLVQVEPHRGAFVTQLSVTTTWEITSLRALLEPYASRLALEAAGPGAEEEREVEAAFAGLEHAVRTRDPVSVADADVAFHRTVFARCGHAMLLAQLETLQVLSRRVVLTNQVSSADAPTLIAQHQPILEAVRRYDPEGVERAVRAHVIEAGELLMSRMAALEPGWPRAASRHSFSFGRWPGGRKPRSRIT